MVESRQIDLAEQRWYQLEKQTLCGRLLGIEHRQLLS
jgi:hypothetical protein